MFRVSFGTSPGIEHAHLHSGWRKHRVDGATSNENHGQVSRPTLRTDDIWSGLSASFANLGAQLAGLRGSDPFANDSQVGATAFGAQLINKQRGVMEIHTQEGDVVTLNFRARTAVTYSSAQVSDGTTEISSSELSVSSRSRVSLQVQGDLNDEELAAINDLVGQVNDLTDTFFAGNVDAALSQAMSLSYDDTQLADYTLQLKLKQSFQGYAAVVMPANNAPSEEPAPADVTDSSNKEPTVSTTTDESVAPTDSEAAAASTEPAASTVPAETPEAAPASSDANNGSISLLAYREKVKAHFSQNDGDIRLGLSYELKVKLLVTTIQQSAPADQASDAAADTLTSYLTAPAE